MPEAAVYNLRVCRDWGMIILDMPTAPESDGGSSNLFRGGLRRLPGHAVRPEDLPISASLMEELNHWSRAMDNAKKVDRKKLDDEGLTLARQLSNELGYETTVTFSRQVGILELNSLAERHIAEGQYGQAKVFYKRSLVMAQVLGPDHVYVASALKNLAELYMTLGWYARAEPLLKRSLEINEKALGPDHGAVATSLEDLKALYRATDRREEAEKLKLSEVHIRANKR